MNPSNSFLWRVYVDMFNQTIVIVERCDEIYLHALFAVVETNFDINHSQGLSIHCAK